MKTARTLTEMWTTELLVVNEATSPIARGWLLAGVQRLYPQPDNSVLITEGDGSAVFFRKRGATTFFSPLGDFSTLVVNGTGWKRLYADSTAVYFNSAGRVTDVYDRFSNRMQFFYDGSNRLTTIRDPNSQDLVLAYGTHGLASIRDNISPFRYTNLTVPSDSTLTAIQDPDGISTTFVYDGSRRLWKIRNRRGDTTTVGYQTIEGKATGKVATITAPPVPIFGVGTVSPVTTFAPWQTVGVPYLATASNAVPVVTLDTVYGRLTDPGSHTGKFTVNRWGSPAVVTNALGRTDSTRFDVRGLPIRMRSAAGAVDSAVYNDIGLPTLAKSAGVPATRIRYAAWAQADSVWADGGLYGARYFIGANGRVDSVRIAGGTSDSAKTRYRYDSRGRVDSVADPLQHLVQRTWYAGTNGNRSKDSLPGGRVATYAYDPYGRDTSVSRPGFARTRTFYSIINRADSVRDGVNPVPIRYGYDNLFLTSVTDPKGQIYGFTYNALGWLIQRTDPTSHSDLYEYSRDGELRRWTNRRGQPIDYSYDLLHRATTKSGTNTATESWVYPSDTVVVATALALGATDTVTVDTLLGNHKGQLLRAITKLGGQNYVRRYAYTSAGALDSVIPSGGGLAFHARHYVWNLRRGTLSSIKLGASANSTTLWYSAEGLMSSVTLPGGDQVTRTYSALHTTGGIATTASYTNSVNRSSGFDAANRIQRHITGPNSGHQYSYDGLGRLIADSTLQSTGTPCDPHNPPDENGDPCTFNPGWTVHPGPIFSYDSAGNRRDGGGSIYTTGNRIQAFAGCGYQTDDDGNVTQRVCGTDTVRLTWTAENRLASLMRLSQTTTFAYNTAGRLVRMAKPGQVRRFLWEGDNVLAELDSVTGKVAEYSYYPGLDNPHALIVGTTKYFAHRDMLGNVIALTDSNHNLSRWYEYTAWGETWNGTDSAGLAGRDRARFKGALWFGDALPDLYYMRNRWYEPQSGRFLSEDPIGLQGGVNHYVYAANDPINHADPTGLKVVCMVRDWFFNGQFLRRDVLYCWDDGQGGRDDGQGGGGATGSEPGQPQEPTLLCTQVVQGQRITTRTSIASDAREFINELAANGFVTLVGPNSSYRNDLQQGVLYQMHQIQQQAPWINLGVAFAAPPGSSNHQGGYNIDINSFSNWRSWNGHAHWLILSIAGRHGFTQSVSGDWVHFEHMSAPRSAAGIQAAINEARASDGRIGECP